jgi:hypothetical protein
MKKVKDKKKVKTKERPQNKHLVPFTKGNKAATVNKGKKKLTRKKIQIALIQAADFLGKKLKKHESINNDELVGEANRILLKDCLRASNVQIRREFAVMIFKHFNQIPVEQLGGVAGPVGMGGQFNVLIMKTEKDGKMVMEELKKVSSNGSSVKDEATEEE